MLPGPLVLEIEETAVNFDYVKLSQDLFNAHNRMRIDPVSFSKELLKFGDAVAANIVKTQKVHGKLTYCNSLRLSSNLLVTDQGITGAIGHVDSKGRSPFDRMNLYGQWESCAGENAMYGSINALGILAGLIKSPPHFAILFSTCFKVCGMSCGPHPKYGTVAVLDYAGGFNYRAEELLV